MTDPVFERLRERLREMRAQGVTFDGPPISAWSNAKAWVLKTIPERERDEARTVLEATEDAWRRAYDGGPQTELERALTALAGGLDVPLGDDDIGDMSEEERRCAWCGEVLPGGQKPTAVYCPPPRRCKREANYAREQARKHGRALRLTTRRTAASRDGSDGSRPTSGILATTTTRPRIAA